MLLEELLANAEVKNDIKFWILERSMSHGDNSCILVIFHFIHLFLPMTISTYHDSNDSVFSNFTYTFLSTRVLFFWLFLVGK